MDSKSPLCQRNVGSPDTPLSWWWPGLSLSNVLPDLSSLFYLVSSYCIPWPLSKLAESPGWVDVREWESEKWSWALWCGNLMCWREEGKYNLEIQDGVLPLPLVSHLFPLICKLLRALLSYQSLPQSLLNHSQCFLCLCQVSPRIVHVWWILQTSWWWVDTIIIPFYSWDNWSTE